MKFLLFCLVPNTMAPLFTYIYLYLGTALLLNIRGCFHLMRFGDLPPAEKKSLITVNRIWWKLFASSVMLNIKILWSPFFLRLVLLLNILMASVLILAISVCDRVQLTTVSSVQHHPRFLSILYCQKHIKQPLRVITSKSIFMAERKIMEISLM